MGVGDSLYDTAAVSAKLPGLGEPFPVGQVWSEGASCLGSHLSS